jgi:hypothetical protein
VLDGDVGRPLVEVVHRVAALGHDRGNERVGLLDGDVRLIDEARLSLSPRLPVAFGCGRAQGTDVELVVTLLSLAQLADRRSIALLVRQALVLGPETVLHLAVPLGLPGSESDHAEDDDGTDYYEPDPVLHESLLSPPPVEWHHAA